MNFTTVELMKYLFIFYGTIDVSLSCAQIYFFKFTALISNTLEVKTASNTGSRVPKQLVLVKVDEQMGSEFF